MAQSDSRHTEILHVPYIRTDPCGFASSSWFLPPGFPGSGMPSRKHVTRLSLTATRERVKASLRVRTVPYDASASTRRTSDSGLSDGSGSKGPPDPMRLRRQGPRNLPKLKTMEKTTHASAASGSSQRQRPALRVAFCPTTVPQRSSGNAYHCTSACRRWVLQRVQL